MPRLSHSIRQGNDPLLPLVVGTHASVAAVHEDLLDLIHCIRLLFGRLSLPCTELRMFANQELVTKDRNWPHAATADQQSGSIEKEFVLKILHEVFAIDDHIVTDDRDNGR